MCSKKIIALSTSILFLSACGGGGDSDPPTTPKPPALPDTSLTGVFIDSPVAGITYKTATRSGVTNVAGEYQYIAGEVVSFSIGSIMLGKTAAGPVVTPLSLVAGATDATDPVVTNILRLLLTLDEDGNPDNGITISAATTTAAAGQTVDFTAADLATDPGMNTLLPLLPGTPALVDSAAAQLHFTQTLAAQSRWGSLAWGSNTWQSKTP